MRTNVYAGGRLIATYDNPTSNPGFTALHFQITDPLGSRRVQTDSIGWPEEQFTNLPYGDGFSLSAAPNPPPGGADDSTPLHFTGKERDSESGNDYFGARYYASTTGRFLSPDWSAKQEPVPYAKLDNPQTLNLYGYVLNNPLTKTDPDGHDLWDKIANWAHGNGFRDTPNPQQPAAPAPPTPQQVPGAGPTVVLPGQKYPSAQNAAVNTINNINPTSIKEDREYAARAVQNADGSFSVVGPNPGGQSGSQFPAVPDGTLDAAQIHTHGAADPGYDNENFSTRQTSGVNNDIDDARHDMVPSYLGTPSGTIKVYNPSTNTTTIIQQPTSNPQ